MFHVRNRKSAPQNMVIKFENNVLKIQLLSIRLSSIHRKYLSVRIPMTINGIGRPTLLTSGIRCQVVSISRTVNKNG